jgi:hypothetical protein
VLVIFAGLAALAIAFVWKFLPETEGLALEDIVKLYEPRSATTKGSSGDKLAA